jgi:hypothetical protein
MPELTKREKEILESMLDSWVDDGMPVPGRYCNKQVIDLIAKLGIKTPDAILEY